MSANPPLRLGRKASTRLTVFGANLILVPASILVVFPFVFMILTSFKALPELWVFPPRLLPERFILDSYRHVLVRFRFGMHFLNSLLVGAAVTALQVGTSALAAYPLACARFKGREAVFYLILGTMMIPPQVTMIPLYILLARINWIDTYWSLIVPLMANPFGIFLIRQFYLSIPAELIDAATIDGCSRLRVLSRIMIPLSMPVIAAFSLFAFLGNWNSYLWPLIVTNEDRMRTLPVGLRFFLNSEGGPIWNDLMAATTLSLLPVLIVYVVAQKHVLRGFGAIGTGVKG